MHTGWSFRNFCAAALLALLCAPVLAGSTHSFTFQAQAYPGSRDRQYKVYVPDGLSGAASMVMALHGCQQTHDDVLRDWGMTAAADRSRRAPARRRGRRLTDATADQAPRRRLPRTSEYSQMDCIGLW